jgi:ATP/maltotriose-dependent transcriptional regulator MalT
VSNSRIAPELEVLHLMYIYGKLDVNSRTQAVVRLRESNLH